MANIFEIIKHLFEGSSASKMSFYKLYNKMKEWRKNDVFINSFDLPDIITFPTEFWDKAAQLHKLTLADGHERAITVFYCDGDVIVTSIVRGETSTVTPKGEVRVQYLPTSRREYFTKFVYVDEKVYSKKEIYYKNLPKKVELQYLFNMHTHPQHENNYYSFFSLVDINSLINSRAPITGMINDKLWILMRTNQSPRILNNYEEQEINVQSLNEKIKLGVYCAEFYKPLIRQY